MHHALHQQGLERYYALRGDQGTPVSVLRASLTWLEPVAEQVALREDASRLSFDVQGLHCVGCVWLIQELFARTRGGRQILLNPGRGRLDLEVDADFPLLQFARELLSFGYVLGPAHRAATPRTDGLVLRLGICVALALNSMVLSAALYLGLTDGKLYHVFHELNFSLGAVSVAVGGSYFITRAWHAARRGMTHLDQPIALGVVLAFVGSSIALWQGSSDVYFDTLCVFVALMLAGRFLQERALENNRRFLLEDDGIERLPVRRLREGHVRWIECAEIRAEDELLIAPGDLIPCESTVLDEGASASLQWIDGEPWPRHFGQGDVLPAGAFNVGNAAVRVRASEDFIASALRDVLGPRAPEEGLLGERFWSLLARWYVVLVVLTAGIAAAVWGWQAGLQPALSVATAILVVTCPCAFGIATPLAYEIVLSRLRRVGLFVTSAGFLDRACLVRQVVFDKTGTLTTGALVLEDEGNLDVLSEGERDVLYQLAVRSSHPKATAVSEVLARRGATVRSGLEVREISGRGLELRLGGDLYRLGAVGWAAPLSPAAQADLIFAKQGRPLLALHTMEQHRPDARSEVGALQDAGYRTCILTGDGAERAANLASELGVPHANVAAGQKPDDKARWLQQNDGSLSLMIGDGVNDAPAMRAALCGGTPAVDRPFMPARTDFYFVTPGLHPIRVALSAARRLRHVVRSNLVVAFLYNLIAVTIACLGWMSPWMAAVLMPASSLAVIGLTLFLLRSGGSTWR